MVDTVDMSSADLERGLHALGYQEFRPGQREAVEVLLRERRLLLVAPTGGGKSLIYQLPAVLLPGTTVVVSPLIALMVDQVQALEAAGVSATYVASTLDGQEVRLRMAKLAAGEFDLVYVAPERLSFPGFRGLLQELRCPLIAIDEAHCISQWGHDFRPEYLQLGGFLQALPDAAILACTATATPVVRDEILARLGLSAQTPQIIRGFARPNLALRAREIAAPSQRDGHVDALLFEALHSAGQPQGAAIVYAPTRKQVDRETERLGTAGWRVTGYHAGMSPAQRTKASKRFSTGKVDVVVATNAFGMGIDRSDVRAVVHLAPPGSIEAYYQEVGRAGRDGERAYGLLLTSSRDLPLRRNLLERPIDGMAPDPAVVEHKWNLFLELMRWVEGGSCRHDAILRYFGDENELLAGCGICDVCQEMGGVDHVDSEDLTLIVRKALSAVARIHGRFGISAAVALLHGSQDDRLRREGLDQTKTFGALAEHSEDWLTRLLRRCVTAGWVTFSLGTRPVALLTSSGNEVMQGQRPARILLPSTRSAKPVAGGVRAPSGRDLQTPEEHALFEALRAHRLSVAREQQVPPYVVASDRTLRDIASLRPDTMEKLLQCHGIGPAKAEKYGEDLLGVVRSAL